jgi:AbrB family looped-hinge helix DNA binding protein
MSLGETARERRWKWYDARRRKEQAMALVRLLRGGQVTLPAEIRQKLRLAQGDYLEAEVVDDGVLLKRVSSVEQAWQRIAEAPGSVRYIGPEPRPTPEEEEEWLAEEVKAARREEHAKRRR